MSKTKVVTNIRKDNGTPMTKAEVILELAKASAISGYRYGDRATEIYDTFVKNEIFDEEEREI